MNYIAIGVAGFLVIHTSDFVALKKVPWAKPLTWVLGGGPLVYALTMACLQPDKLPLPNWATWLGWALLAIAAPTLLYSLFINLPFRKTYIARGVGDKLITSGLYALVRHPGVHWFILLVLSLVLVSRSGLVLIAAPIFIFLDIVLVIVQDRFFFGKMFTRYEDYRRETPMLLPNRKSLKAFLNSIRQART
jgi:protein-S-isoprenylcysteine O-methyltransferase Ste14